MSAVRRLARVALLLAATVTPAAAQFAQGPQGPQGPVGPQGPQGPRGAQGSVGLLGAPGATGATGAIGSPGAAGLAGAAGSAGPIFIFRGAVDPSRPYAINDVVVSSGATYLAIDVTSGDPADPGSHGWQLFAARGDAGLQGAIGNVGAQGAKGATGLVGSIGAQGPDGSLGATGPHGPDGVTGATGAAGVAGLVGSSGAAGPPGLTGATGNVGPQGIVGPTGPIGAQGLRGIAGANGVDGTKGSPGPPGPPGIPGASLGFEIRRINANQTLTMATNNRSVVYLVTTPPSNVTLTLPPAADAQARFVTIQRMDNKRLVVVRPQAGETVDGARVPISLDDRNDGVTLVSDGHEWVVLFKR